MASLIPAGIASAGSVPPSGPAPFNALQWKMEHGYLPLHGVAALERAKAYAAAWVQAHHPAEAPGGPFGADPTIGASWQGVFQTNLAPPDTNGAIGPKSYLEIINLQLAIYKRNGSKIASASLQSLTGHSSLSDPTILWDPNTKRFYYNVWDVANGSMDWGFSKDNNPNSIPTSFCNYETGFGYPVGSFPDYPKLGQTKGFLMIGINFYPTPQSQAATQSDLLWISKPQGGGPITTCPAANTFKSGKFADLRNQDGTQAFTPVPAIQTDPSKSGYVTTMFDIECPPICGKGNLLTLYTLKPSKGDPTVPTLSSGRSITVDTFKPPPDAPQKNTANLLDTLDGRLTHAVSGIDPAVGKTTVWISHAVLGGAGSQVRWYEINPAKPQLVQTGKVTDSNLYVFNGGISTDRTVSGAGAAHGSTMVLGFSTSSSNTFPAIQMVSKVGSNPQSGFVKVQQSSSFEADFSCTPVCRWGDYSGATPDPAADLGAANGEVWLSNQWSTGTWQTWNWEAIP